MVDIRTRDVFATMRPDLLLVQSRLEEVVRIDYPGVSDLVLGLVRAGGKRLRPLILLLAGRAYGNDRDSLVTAAAGVELLHTASLVHDDTVDRAGTRRGRPTLNSILPSGAVILLGDFLFAQSAMLAAATNSPRVVRIFASTLADICDGQLQEIFFAHRLDQSREEYERRIFGKTASLFAGSAEMGAIIGNAPEDAVQALRQYASDVGMAFQIVDDVLDLTASESVLGKPVASDLREGKVTMAVIHALERCSPEEKQMIATVVEQRAFNGVTHADILDILTRYTSLEAAHARAAQYAESARKAICTFPDSEIKRALLWAPEFVVAREK
jgi:geranylgeranyl pyrophosphate synthase